jgi:hypothetical protein
MLKYTLTVSASNREATSINTARPRDIHLHSTAQHSTAQHSTAQHSTAQHSTAQHSTAQQLMQQNQ